MPEIGYPGNICVSISFLASANYMAESRLALVRPHDDQEAGARIHAVRLVRPAVARIVALVVNIYTVQICRRRELLAIYTSLASAGRATHSVWPISPSAARRSPGSGPARLAGDRT